MTPSAYQLQWYLQHLFTTDEQNDLLLERTKEHTGVSTFWPVELDFPEGLPNPIIFAANFGHVTYTHYPVNDRHWPVMSRQMLDVLLSVREFPHRAIPVAIIDPILYWDEPDPDANFVEQRLKSADHRFVVVQLLEHLDILDEEASGVKRRPTLPRHIRVEQYRFNVPPEDLPPLFRLSIEPMHLFVSAEARQALAEAGIAGPEYLSLGGYTKGIGDEVDVPVPVPTLPEEFDRADILGFTAMTHLPLPGFLYGEDGFEVSVHPEPLIRHIAKGRPALDMLLPTAVPESGQSSVPVVMTPHGFTPGFHISSLMPPLYDALINEALETGTEEGHAQLMTRLTDLYAEVLTTPWGVLCSLVNDAQMWLFEDSPMEDKLHHERFLLMLKAAEREFSWLRSLAGRYEYGGEKPGHLWQAHTVITWLAARSGLPAPTSQATWESAVRQLLQVVRHQH